MAQEIDRRTFMALVGVGSGIAGCFTKTDDGEPALPVGGGTDEGVTTVATGEVESFLVADSADELEEPDKVPAVALTLDEGLKVWTGGE